ncbi:MAG: Xenotropic and polytropic retrovirus receptor 1 [Candelina submexicana]|nr:MAG: Xenotropic and polytropic retrovirus receptor 1 [Candelina submexicana]
MGNIELFFCLYARDWNDPAQCNSSHSRLLGFFSTLPGIWRALQCIRRYYDTRNAFPHLVNCGKYSFTILYYMTLSLYRMDKNAHLFGIWDLAMDWSKSMILWLLQPRFLIKAGLCNPYAKHPFLRDTLGFRRPSIYYMAMIIDSILRFNWIFYAIYRRDVQHSAVLSFLVAFSEVLRRGMWTLFRVENEHCTNVGRFRASRDVALPYNLRMPASEPTSVTDQKIDEEHPIVKNGKAGKGKSPIHSPNEIANRRSSGADLERATTTESQPPKSGSLRLRKTRSPQASTPLQRGFSRIGTMMTEAHAQDFERKRKPVVVEGDVGASSVHGDEAGTSDDDDDEEDEDETEIRNSEDLREARAHLASARGEGDGER